MKLTKNITPLLLCLGTPLAKGQSDSTKSERFSFHAQCTSIGQYKPAFTAPYSGINSLLTKTEDAVSLTATIFTAARLWKNGLISFDPELSGGSGLSKTLGVADATNGETFRIGSPKPKLYIARLFLQQVIPFSKNQKYLEGDYNKPAGQVPVRYLRLTAGKIGIADYFDSNIYSHDPRTQFMSWGLMSNGAWDYPANTRGYTPSFVIEYFSEHNEARLAVSMEPTQANGNQMNSMLGKAASYTCEYARHFTLKSKPGCIRLLAYYSTANMGNYRQSILSASATPDITQTRIYGRSKYGFGINAEQAVGRNCGLFFRTSWNDGNNETWAFTEIDQSASAGLVVSGNTWKRKNDRIGFAAVVSGLSKPHRDYLAAGGQGFMLGDGQLNYTSEKLFECYYSLSLLKQTVSCSAAWQLLMDPGYNTDRQGPVNIFSARLHVRI